MMESTKIIAVVRECPECHKEHSVYFNPHQYDAYLLWKNGLVLIQQALPELTPVERECLLSGLCPDCQARIFGGHEE